MRRSAGVVPSMQDASENAGGSILLTRTLVVALALYVGLIASLFVPSIGMTVFVLAFCASYLSAYVGVLAGAVTFSLTWLAARRVLPKRRQRLRLAVQLAAVAFALAGIILMASIRFIPGYKLHMTGYWLHARVWLDIDRVRDWADSLDIPGSLAASTSFGAPVAYERWPRTLRMTGVPSGRVYVDNRTSTVTLAHGNALSGHWGIHIAAKGQEWHGDGDECWIKKVRDGAWTWATED